jgi:hypothetical protein
VRLAKILDGGERSKSEGTIHAVAVLLGGKRRLLQHGQTSSLRKKKKTKKEKETVSVSGSA